MRLLRKKINEEINIVFEFIPGGIFGLFSVSLMSIFIILSYSNFPGYDMLNNDISILGIGPGISAPLFNIGIFLTGLFNIPFFLYLGKILQQETDKSKIPKKIIYLSFVGCISLSLIGCFPVINRKWALIHATLAGTFFIMTLLVLFLISTMMLKDPRFPNFHASIGLIVASIIGFYLVTRRSIIEWVVLFALGLWMFDISIFTLYKKSLFSNFANYKN
jgi:hypothetical membrane protein